MIVTRFDPIDVLLICVTLISIVYLIRYFLYGWEGVVIIDTQPDVIIIEDDDYYF